MKVIPIALAAQYAAGTAELCQCLRIERRDGFIVRLTSAQRNVLVPAGTLNQWSEDMGGLYLADPGMMQTEISQTVGLSVANLGAKFGKDDTYINRSDVLQGLWEKAKYRLFGCSVSNPEVGVDSIIRGHLGEYQIGRNSITYELRELAQMLQQPIVRYLSKTCVVRFGSQGEAMCNVDIALYTHDGTATSVTSRRVFIDTSRTEPDNYFKAGMVTFTSGKLMGVSLQVAAFASGQFTFAVQPFETPAPGDTYTAIAGCEKTREACKSFDNIYNMQAAPDAVGVDWLASPT